MKIYSSNVILVVVHLYLVLTQNGLYSMLPYIAMFVMANTVSHSIDKLREKGYLSTTVARKVAMIIGEHNGNIEIF